MIKAGCRLYERGRRSVRACRAGFGVLIAVVVFAGPAAAQAGTTPVRWLVKTNDLALLQAQAAVDRVRLPTFTWAGCGGLSDPDSCKAGQNPIYTNFWTLRDKARSHYAGVVIFDIEPWKITPASQRADPLKWICKAGQLARSDKQLRVIIAPFAKAKSAMIAEEVEAARCGAYAVDIQSQFANGQPRTGFRPFVTAAVKAIRKVSRSVIILAGLATNNPIPQTAQNLALDYRYALRAGVQGFWLNANAWSPTRCTAAEGGIGCPEVGIQFLNSIGLTS